MQYQTSSDTKTSKYTAKHQFKSQKRLNDMFAQTPKSGKAELKESAKSFLIHTITDRTLTKLVPNLNDQATIGEVRNYFLGDMRISDNDLEQYLICLCKRSQFFAYDPDPFIQCITHCGPIYKKALLDMENDVPSDLSISDEKEINHFNVNSVKQTPKQTQPTA